MDDVTAPARIPAQPGDGHEEPEEGKEDDIPSDDHDPDGTQPGPEHAPEHHRWERYGQRP